MSKAMTSFQAIIERAWIDEEFKNNLVYDPKQVLTELGAKIPEDLEIEIHEDTLNVQNYVLLPQEKIETLTWSAQETIIDQLIKRAAVDNLFKALLISNPKAVIKKVTGQEIPEEFFINIYEDTATTKHIVIPLNPNQEELSDSELEAVAGGFQASIGGLSIGLLQSGFTNPPYIKGFV